MNIKNGKKGHDMKVISFLNQKGGTGKTTSCINIGARLAQKGFKVLLVDVDPQGNLTVSLGIRTEGKDEKKDDVLPSRCTSDASFNFLGNRINASFSTYYNCHKNNPWSETITGK